MLYEFETGSKMSQNYAITSIAQIIIKKIWQYKIDNHMSQSSTKMLYELEIGSKMFQNYAITSIVRLIINKIWQYKVDNHMSQSSAQDAI